jgi:hypothetical protein
MFKTESTIPFARGATEFDFGSTPGRKAAEASVGFWLTTPASSPNIEERLEAIPGRNFGSLHVGVANADLVRTAVLNNCNSA